MIVSPVTPVPVIVGVLSPVGDDGASIAGAADAVLSTVTDNAEDADEAVPATSVCVAVIE